MQTPTFFKDPVNPTLEELRKWAYGDYYQPEQDFQLFVVQDPLLALEFASDENCPTKQFFLESIYVWIGDRVKTNDDNNPLINKLLLHAKTLDNIKIKQFVSNAEQLLSNPTSYTYEKWGIGSSLAKS